MKITYFVKLKNGQEYSFSSVGDSPALLRAGMIADKHKSEVLKVHTGRTPDTYRVIYEA